MVCSFISDPHKSHNAVVDTCPLLKALQAAQRRCEELEEALNSRSQVVEMLQQEVSSADQQKQVDKIR